MATKHFCDKCHGETKTGLYRIEVVARIYSGSDGLDDGTTSELDLCAPCLRKILEDTNTPDEVPAEQAR